MILKAGSGKRLKEPGKEDQTQMVRTDLSRSWDGAEGFRAIFYNSAPTQDRGMIGFEVGSTVKMP